MPNHRIKTPQGEKLAGESETVMELFGGPGELAKALRACGFHIHDKAIYRWRQPKSHNGTGGYIPNARRQQIIVAARAYGFVLPQEFHL